MALMLSIFVATMGISMVSPLLPVYAKELGASKGWLGFTFSAFAISQAICEPIIGRLSDRYPRKPFIIGGLLIYMAAALGYLTADTFWQLIAFRMLSGVGTSALFSVARAYVGDMTPPGHEGRWLGVYATADIVGFATGPSLAGIVRQFVGFDAVFIAMAAMMAASALIVLWWLPAKAPKRVSTRPRAPAMSFGAALKDRLVIAIATNAFILSVGSGASFAFLALRLEDDVMVGPALIGLAFTVQDFTAGVGQPFFGRMADRFDRRILVVVGLALQAVLTFLLGVAAVYVVFVGIMLAMGAAGAISQPASGAIQVVAGRRVGMGTVLGISSMTNSAGLLIGSIIGGIIADIFNLSATFYFASIVMGAGVAIFFSLTANLRLTDPAAESAPLQITEERAVGSAAASG